MASAVLPLLLWYRVAWLSDGLVIGEPLQAAGPEEALLLFMYRQGKSFVKSGYVTPLDEAPARMLRYRNVSCHLCCVQEVR